MLISFNLKNFKTFAEAASVSLLAHKSEKSLSSSLIDAGKDGLLPAVAIYGPNASGKSNLLIGMQFLAHAITSSQSRWDVNKLIPVDANVAEALGASRFEFEFFALSGTRYRYGCEAYPTHFASEWLYSYPKGRERLLFERVTERTADDFETKLTNGPTLTGDVRSHASSGARVRKNSLYLSALAQDNQLEASEVQAWSRRIFFDRNTAPERIMRDLTSRLAAEDPVIKRLLLALVRIADSNIVDIEFDEVEEAAEVPAALRSEPESIVSFYKQNAKYRSVFVSSVKGERHRISFARQSRGVKRAYTFANSIIFSLKFGGISVVDELESSMHPHVASQILALFQSRLTNPHGAQIVFTTHETRLLNLQHLRRDQIWFVEKEDGCSSLYSLIEFGPRKDENFELGYLRGKYGALPHTGVDPDWMEAVREPASPAELIVE